MVVVERNVGVEEMDRVARQTVGVRRGKGALSSRTERKSTRLILFFLPWLYSMRKIDEGPFNWRERGGPR